MIKVGIIGGAGYTAGELIRLLINHPEAEIVFINSSSNAGNKITDVHEGLYGETDLVFTDELPLDKIDVLFFCTAHGDTKKFMESHNLPEELKIIDLSMDYRIASPEHDFIYGLPELNRRATCKAKHVANPGCFATCIQLGLLPLAKHLMLNNDIMVNAITGSTGAGVKPGSTSHFSWRNNNMSVYKAFEHQHVPEIKQSLKQLQNSFDADIDFIPYRGDFARGIFATIVVKTKVALDEIVRMYEEYYAKDSFVHIVEKNIDLKQVVNTNKCLLHLEKHGDKLLIAVIVVHQRGVALRGKGLALRLHAPGSGFLGGFRRRLGGLPGVIVSIPAARKGSDGEGGHAQDYRQHRRKQPDHFLILHGRCPPYRHRGPPLPPPPSSRRAG